MNYETFIREGRYLKTLLTLTILTNEERTSSRKNLEHLLDRQIFYPISTRPPSIKEILEHNPITDKNILKRISLPMVMEFPQTFSQNISTRSFSIHTQKQRNAHTKYIDTHQHKWYYFDTYH